MINPDNVVCQFIFKNNINQKEFVLFTINLNTLLLMDDMK